MQLFTTGIEFVWKGLARAGIPFLCDSLMALVEAPNDYLRYVATIPGTTRSPKTWATYGGHLYEFFSWLEANGIEWMAVTEADIAAWRDWMVEQGRKASTVNQRLRGVHAFYRWAVENKKVDATPFTLKDVRVSKEVGFLGHLDASGGKRAANTLALPTHKPIPKFLEKERALAFLETLSPKRVKLMAYFAFLTGMRREEIVGLDYRVLPNPAGRDSTKLIDMVLDPSITPTKGGRERTVKLPYPLAVAAWNYFCNEWPQLAKQHRISRGRDTTRLFLSEAGDELSLRHLNNAFRKACAKSGIRCTPHMLRHTYATYELVRVSAKYGQSSALLWLKDRLGHASISSVEIYVHTLDLVRNESIDAYHTEVCRFLINGY